MVDLATLNHWGDLRDGTKVYTDLSHTEDGFGIATLVLTGPDGEVGTHDVYCDECEADSARDWLASNLACLAEGDEYTLEERLGPYGVEWQREQKEGW